MADRDELYAPTPAARLAAARGLSSRARRKIAADIPGWPAVSPGARNAWLLLVTTKAPSWRDQLLPYPEGPLTLGEPHDGFLYPDPIGFWAEVRRWSIELFRLREPRWSTAEALALTTLVHLGDDVDRLELARGTCQPRMTVFLDEPAWDAAAPDVETAPLAIRDPHRIGQEYVGWWGTAADGSVLGKSPQHPTMHQLYDARDLKDWLHEAPPPR